MTLHPPLPGIRLDLPATEIISGRTDHIKQSGDTAKGGT